MVVGMGLDIYLTEVTDYEREKRHDEEWEALYNRKDRGEITEEEYDELRKTITPHVNRWADDAPNHKSKRYPDHLFDRRYLRSSYNDSGFNHAVPEMIGDLYDSLEYDGDTTQPGSLYWIFEPMGREWDGDEGKVTADDIPKLEESRNRAVVIVNALQQCENPLRVLTISANQFGPHDWLNVDSDKALEIYRNEAERYAGSNGSDSGHYSSINGHFFHKGLEFLAAIPGGEKMFFNDGNWPAMHLIYRSEALDSYTQSAEIIVEFIDEAIELIKRDGAVYMEWSG